MRPFVVAFRSDYETLGHNWLNRFPV